MDSKNLSFRADNSKPLLVRGINPGRREIPFDSLKLQIDKGIIKFQSNKPSQQSRRLPSTISLRIRSRDPRGIWFGQRRYAGELIVTKVGGKLRVVNHLDIEKYLQSVVGSEMPTAWPIEALKAQAIASRTYALNQLNDKKEFDIGSTIKSQVYLGIEAETPRIYRAVSSTRSLVLVYNNRLIDAVFHSSSGGRTANSKDVWEKVKPYLKSVSDYDENAPSYKWEKRFSPEELKLIFFDIGGLNAIRLTKKTSNNRVLEALAYGPKGKLYLSDKELRKRLELKSTMVNFEMSLDDSLPKERYRNSQEYKTIRFKNVSASMPYPLPPLNNKVPKSIDPLPPLVNNYSLIAKGYGSGHGVGMSQWGAKSMAEKGFKHGRILQHYYHGVRLSNFSIRHKSY